MAWKKIILSGSDAHLASTTVGSFNSEDGAAGNISASSALYASTRDITTGDRDQIVVALSSTELAFVDRAEITNAFDNALTAGTGLSAGGTYNGNVARTFDVNVANLAGSGLTGDGSTDLDIVGSTNITVAANNISTGGVIADANRGLEYDEVATDIGLKVDGTTLKLDSNALVKTAPNVTGGAVGLALTMGDGIQSSGTFTFADDRALHVQSGSISSEAIPAYHDALQLGTGSNSALATGKLVDYSSGMRNSTFISINGTNISAGAVGAISKIQGTLSVQGSTDFAHSGDFNVKDQFIVINSGSSPSAADAFGFSSQTGSAASYQMQFSGSSGANTGTWHAALPAGFAGNRATNKIGSVRLNLTKTFETNPNGETFNASELQVGNTMIDTNNQAVWFYTGA